MALPPGFTVGHWTDPAALTGCTVILCAGAATAGVHVGGGAPATIQTDIIGPGSATAILHAVLLTGGSAFGLAAYAGVMRFLEDKGVGVAVREWRVPHVAGAVIFDLGIGDGRVRPDAEAGHAACRMATSDPAEGLVGAGTGGTVAKLLGGRLPGGLGIASVRLGKATVTAIVAVNALGDVWDGARSEWVARSAPATGVPAGGNTTIGAVLTDARVGREAIRRVASTAHDGLARAIRPAHTDLDGDTIFALAYGDIETGAIEVQAAAAESVERAVVRAVRVSSGTMSA